MKNNNIYTDIILAERFRARARLVIARERGEKKEAPTELLAHVKNDFFAGLQWEHGAKIADMAVSVLREYPLTSCMCPYDTAKRAFYSTWVTWDKWRACSNELRALGKWRLIDFEPSACNGGIYLSFSCRPEAVSIINRIIDREEV